MMQAALDILKKYWNYDAFRSPQESIIQHVLDGKDILALMPTGGGKSICFQVPTMMRDGLCIVITPLIALMKDQVFQLKKRNIKAAAIFSGLSYREIDTILDNAVFGYYKFLYVSPERLKTELFIERFKVMPIQLIAVDEAHCISQWGYDFRPPYLEIAAIRQYHLHVPILALTASATPEVQLDIQEKLLFKNQSVFKKSFLRDNIVFMVRHEIAKTSKLIEIIKKLNGSGIVYVRNRNKTKEIANFLRQHHISADFYHAGLSNEERNKKQEAWIENKTQVIVCTNAFGMGIDKSNVRFVVHIDIPETLEAYYQEAGRAGRDGKKSYAIALYTENDKENLEAKVIEKFPPIEEIKKIYNSIFNYFGIALGSGKFTTQTFVLQEFCEQYNYKSATVYYALKFLAQENYLQLNEDVFVPSRIMFALDKLELYKFQVAHSEYDILIKSLLRTYGGIMSQYVKIKEQDIAKTLQISIQNLKIQLHALQQYKVLYYEEKSDKPEVFLLEERLHENNLYFNTKFINERKKIAFYQLENMLHYIENNEVCRQQIICNYFGDNVLPCGNCDICLEKKHNAQKHKNIDEARFDILQNISVNFLSINNIIPDTHFAKADYEFAIRTLLDDKLIEINNNHEIRRK
jgi:ATP-dependent DNA helicase RecQ